MNGSFMSRDASFLMAAAAFPDSTDERRGCPIVRTSEGSPQWYCRWYCSIEEDIEFNVCLFEIWRLDGYY